MVYLEKMNPPFFVYLLESTRGTTYVGATVNLNRRLRQHNKDLKGGAKLTGRAVDKGAKWRRVCYATGFPTWQCALQFEWKWKFLTRKTPKGPALQRRLEALNVLVASERSTSKSIPFSEFNLEVKEEPSTAS
jgi:predicted GIY-YIG superfamily endonuclease